MAAFIAAFSEGVAVTVHFLHQKNQTKPKEIKTQERQRYKSISFTLKA